MRPTTYRRHPLRRATSPHRTNQPLPRAVRAKTMKVHHSGGPMNDDPQASRRPPEPTAPATGLSDVKALGFVDGAYLKATGPGDFAKVTPSASPPTADSCLSLNDATNDRTNRLRVVKGDRVCLRTNIGRIVLLDIQDTTVRGEENSSATAEVTVWTGPATRS
ncbi:hypothetical protein OG864_15370 [Streptomyces sp. NBC_00124]|uniref:hypothetical protein n=1 Tax=Streptomyces sp. NBC_00124 TaxID=2975662 RepID=UPI00225034AD|nr:hypothetical protein [Streptomyces sp. NBC_00124]MCX5360083.1 hypothetical protein [Streptomyces sp. NBC_00124]